MDDSHEIASNRVEGKRKMNFAKELETKPKRPRHDVGGTSNESMADGMTTIHHLSDDDFQEILKYLPFEEQIRIGRVDRRFRRISQTNLWKKKSLELVNFTSDRIASITLFSLKSILKLCSGKLERLQLNGWHNGKTAALLAAIGEYSFPRLINFEMKTSDFQTALTRGSIKLFNDMFFNFVEKIPNLRCLSWEIDALPCGMSIFLFPSGVFPNIETVKFIHSDDNTVRSMTGNVPNLKFFQAKFSYANSKPVIDEFFRTVPKLEGLRIYSSNLCFLGRTHFWNLRSLSRLEIDGPYWIEDNDFKKIADSFPQLQHLTLRPTQSISAAGLSVLASLKALSTLEMTHNLYWSADINFGLRALAACTRLERVNVDFFVTPSTLMSLISFCPELRFFKVPQVLHLGPPTAVVAMLDSLFGIGKRNIELDIFKEEKGNIDIWKSEPVKSALKRLEDDGVIIRLCNDI